MRRECNSAPSTSKGDMDVKLAKYTRELGETKKKVKRREDTLAKLYDLHSLMHSKVIQLEGNTAPRVSPKPRSARTWPTTVTRCCRRA